MKILMLVNWKIDYCENRPEGKQSPDYYVIGEPYWFYRYFKIQPEVDVIDIASFGMLERLEKNVLRFYVWQALKAILKLGKYDLIVSHGMQSGVVISLWRRLFRKGGKHIVFEIGGFNSASETGIALRLMQFASKSIDGLIYHTSSQIHYYKKYFPWLYKKSYFIRFGTDLEFFNPNAMNERKDKDSYILCVGAIKRDWDTLVRAYKRLHTDVKLRIIGHAEERYELVSGVEQIPFIPIKELISQICNARLCVLPLEWMNYSFGQMTLMQQMALGKCVIVAKVPSVIDYIEDMKTAIMYEPGNSEDLKEKMENALANPELCKKIGKDGQDYLLKMCNEKTMGTEIEQIYRKILRQS